MILYRDDHGHFCGSCHQFIPAGDQYSLKDDEYLLPCGKMRIKQMPCCMKCTLKESNECKTKEAQEASAANQSNT